MGAVALRAKSLGRRDELLIAKVAAIRRMLEWPWPLTLPYYPHVTIGEERDGGMRNTQAALRADVRQQLDVKR